MKWKSHKEHYQDALKYMKGKQQGTIHSFKTPWPSFNNCTMQGLEFNTITLIGARPASGKTLLVDQIIREGFALNPGLSLRVLSFQLEMFGRTSKIREFSSVTGLSYKELCSAAEEGVTVDDKYIKQCHQYAISAAKYPIDIIDEAVNVKEFRTEIMQYMAKHATTSKTEDGKEVKHYQHTVVTLDHSVLIKKVKEESSKQEMLANLGEVCTELKKNNYHRELKIL